MVQVPPGSFSLGSKADEGESDEFVFEDGLPDPVQIKHRFSLSRTEVTRGQFSAFVRSTGYQTTAEKSTGCSVFLPSTARDHQSVWNWRSPGFRQTTQHPVVCVSWLDAQAYVAWLRRTTGKPYRLPSEAEVEYVTRFSGETSRSAANASGELLCSAGNVADRGLLVRQQGWVVAPCNDGQTFTAPVSSYPANAMGLHDLLGNVREWTADCYHSRHGIYTTGPAGGKRLSNTGSARQENCQRPISRVIKGGSWADEPRNHRPAKRWQAPPQYRDNDTGFRVARDE
ncbi:formylglycine-generating enzyme family protein [Paucibacter sp. DJ2R-2]|uniref:formylglycine-generating enzyme family protein n=1 Tax=Paucibacter sp. DJ2R-2 TaxID=2893558 RepID=UPI00398C9C8F